MESGLSDPLSPAAVTPTPPPRKRTALTVTLIVSALVLAAGGGVFASNMLRPTPVAASPVSPQTAQAKVTAGSLNAETTVRGKLRFTKQIDLAAARSGVITELPVPDTILAPGAVAYRIDTLPTVVMAGTTPAWRDFATGMTAGPDVKQLEENLRSFGYLDAEPSEDFTWHTRWALRTWQRDLGLPPSDTLSKDLVLFADQPLRVSKLERQLGDRVEAGAKLYPGQQHHNGGHRKPETGRRGARAGRGDRHSGTPGRGKHRRDRVERGFCGGSACREWSRTRAWRRCNRGGPPRGAPHSHHSQLGGSDCNARAVPRLRHCAPRIGGARGRLNRPR